MAILVLGGKLNFNFRAPGAHHHARWMSKVIYTLKIALFKNQLLQLGNFEKEQLVKIETLAIYLCLFYVKYWFCATNATNAPHNDLNLLKLLEKGEKMFEGSTIYKSMVSKSKIKMEKHLWYLSERLVPLAFFSSQVPGKVKQDMAKRLKKYSQPQTMLHQEMPETCSFTSKTLVNFIGCDSWTFFKLYEIEPTFLTKPEKYWHLDDTFLSLQRLTAGLKVVNDNAERVLGLVTQYHTNRVTKNEEQKQYLYTVQKEVRAREKVLMKKSERVTKKL